MGSKSINVDFVRHSLGVRWTWDCFLDKKSRIWTLNSIEWTSHCPKYCWTSITISNEYNFRFWKKNRIKYVITIIILYHFFKRWRLSRNVSRPAKYLATLLAILQAWWGSIKYTPASDWTLPPPYQNIINLWNSYS